jgi:hypothetical protein
VHLISSANIILISVKVHALRNVRGLSFQHVDNGTGFVIKPFKKHSPELSTTNKSSGNSAIMTPK